MMPAHPITADAVDSTVTDDTAALVRALLAGDPDPDQITATLADLHARLAPARDMAADERLAWAKTVIDAAADTGVVTTLAVAAMLLDPAGPGTYADYARARALIA